MSLRREVGEVMIELGWADELGDKSHGDLDFLFELKRNKQWRFATAGAAAIRQSRRDFGRGQGKEQGPAALQSRRGSTTASKNCCQVRDDMNCIVCMVVVIVSARDTAKSETDKLRQ